MSAQPRVLVVADDLTGANDTGVQFAEVGWPSTLRIGSEASRPLAEGGVAAVSTDARARTLEEAASATRDAVEREALAPGDHVYLKVDSTLRGSVPGQLHGALAARRRVRPDAFAVLCPAYPAMGRTVEDGRLLVHGEPVTQSPAGRDPVTPVLWDAIAELVPGAALVDLADTAAATAQAWEAVAGVSDVLVADARTDDDLERVAAVVAALGDAVVPAGSAGLAAPLARIWAEGRDAAGRTRRPTIRRPLVLVSSHHATARDQVAALVEARDDVTLVTTRADDLLQGVDPQAPEGSGPVVLLSPEERIESGLGAELAGALGSLGARWLADGGYDGAVLVGGDGAQALLRAADAHGIAIRGRLLEGVPDGRLAGGPLDGLPVATKAGGFGETTTLITALQTLGTDMETENAR